MKSRSMRVLEQALACFVSDREGVAADADWREAKLMLESMRQNPSLTLAGLLLDVLTEMKKGA